MPPRKRNAVAPSEAVDEPVPKRRSLRRVVKGENVYKESSDEESKNKSKAAKKTSGKRKMQDVEARGDGATGAQPRHKASKPSTARPAKAASQKTTNTDVTAGVDSEVSRAVSEDPDVDSIPTTNPDAPRHEGEWYWLMKAEPETRIENGVDVRFSIDDLRAREKPEGWDGIRNYAARNHMRNMNAGDKAFFYHSNCKEPGIVGVMEIVKEYSEDKSARRPGTPYYDASATKDKPKWDLVHVSFRKKFAVPIGLKELRDLGQAGGPLADMMMLKQTRLSVSRVSEGEWKALCELADQKAKEAGLEHEE